MTAPSMRRARQACVLALLNLCLGTVAAQSAITFNSGRAVFEGNGGTRLLRFEGQVSPPNTQLITGRLIVTALSGSTGGTTCGAGVDFQRVDTGFTLAPNTATIFTDVVICGDATVEPDESFTVALTQVAGGGGCTIERCTAIGTIRNDDGPPRVAIRNASTTEPPSGTISMPFTVELSHPSASATSVAFATRSGTARAGSSCAPFLDGSRPDYITRSGTLTIPADTLTGSFGVTICGDNLSESDESFTVELSNPAPAGVTIADATATGTIRNIGFAGAFAWSPEETEVRVGEAQDYALRWTVPEGEVWRDLRTIDLRIGDGRDALWVRWEEAGNTFALCTLGEHGGAVHHDWHDAGVPCGAGAPAGTDAVLQTPLAQLQLAHSSVTGSGPNGPDVTLQLRIAFTDRGANRTLPVELAATDDLGNHDGFASAGTVRVLHARRLGH